jgi:[citrate (pro-3S)-lyase] ligase
LTTNLYNSTLLKVLPPECEVIVIPRKTLDEKVISASTVRRELDKGNFAAIRELVPDVTYRYLEENYGKYS